MRKTFYSICFYDRTSQSPQLFHRVVETTQPLKVLKGMIDEAGKEEWNRISWKGVFQRGISVAEAVLYGYGISVSIVSVKDITYANSLAAMLAIGSLVEDFYKKDNNFFETMRDRSFEWMSAQYGEHGALTLKQFLAIMQKARTDRRILENER
jgi:hypothetical protein